MFFWVKHYIRVKKIFLQYMGLWVLKDAEFKIDFKNINLPCEKIHLKKLFKIKGFRLHTGGPL
jgi:hypothetical protein